ncbi:MAG: ribosomal-protein-alanine N-acetyltransferase [Rhodobacteraceae bacterium HLUCCO18]|nr:MAG: ribosomal-protein-alanine N-acetyltransferase [Rhodobacteraceae bacterium HLUCCO18]
MTLHARPTPAEALFAAIPVIETERFLLRGYRPGDLATFTAFYASPRSRYVGGPMTAELACRAFMTYAGHWHVRGYGRWMVEEKATGATLGNVGLWYPDGWPEPEIGWTLFEGAEGRGVAFETALAARAHAYDTLGWTTAISLIAPENARSRALAERLGAVRDGDFTHERYGTLQVWRHPAPGPEACP